MEDRSQRDGPKEKPWVGRLDRAAGEMNAFLLVLALGLAVLDGTCFFAFKVREAMPPVARAVAEPVSEPVIAAGQAAGTTRSTRQIAPTPGW